MTCTATSRTSQRVQSVGRCHWSGSMWVSNLWKRSFSSAVMAMASWWPIRGMLLTGTTVWVLIVVLLG